MKIQLVLFDIDGTLLTGIDPIPGAREAVQFLKDNQIPYRYISNGTRRSRAKVRETPRVKYPGHVGRNIHSWICCYLISQKEGGKSCVPACDC